MPVTNLTWRAKCGAFRWTFTNFMQKRIKSRSEAIRALTVCWPLNPVRTVIVGLLLTVVCVDKTSSSATQLSTFEGTPLPVTFPFGPCHDVFQSFLMLATARYKHKAVFLVIRLSVTQVWVSHRKRGLSCTTWISIFVFIAGLLLACGDVEANPGPQSSEHREERYEDSRTYPYGSETRMDFRPQSLQSDSHCQQTDTFMQQMANFQLEMCDRINCLTAWSKSCQAENDQLKEDVKYLSSKYDSLEQQCRKMEDWQHYLQDMTSHLHDHQDQLERASRQNNLRFFNVAEGPKEDSRSCEKMVIQLLNRFYPVKAWTKQDVVRAHRVGKQNRDGRPRTILAQLLTWPDKLAIMEEKAYRKEMAYTLGIRVAGDLTIQQQSEVRWHSSNGRAAYFRGGRLHFRRDQTSPRQRRGFPAGKRRRSTESDSLPENRISSSQRKTKAGTSPVRTSSPSEPITEQYPDPSPIMPPPLSSMMEFPNLVSKQKNTTNGTSYSQNTRRASVLKTRDEETARETEAAPTKELVLTEQTAKKNQDPGQDQMEPTECSYPRKNSDTPLRAAGSAQSMMPNKMTPTRTPSTPAQSPSKDHQQSAERSDVPSNEVNVYTPPAEPLDDSETLVKQPFGTCSPVPDVECQSHREPEDSPLQNSPSCRVLVNTPVTEQCVSLEYEEVSMTPQAGFGTRSKARSKQLQITDSFTCTGKKTIPDPAGKDQPSKTIQGSDGSQPRRPLKQRANQRSKQAVREEGRATSTRLQEKSKKTVEPGTTTNT